MAKAKIQLNGSFGEALDVMAETLRQAGTSVDEVLSRFAEAAESYAESGRDLDYIPGCWCCDPTKTH